MDFTAIITSLLTLLAGIGVFLIACQMMSSNLEAASSEKLKQLFSKASNSKLMGVGIGALGTAAIQSSGATTVMTIGFVNAGIISLAQAATIIYGANIGTTVTAQIVALGMFGGNSLLPADAQSFIKEFFADKTVSYVKKDRELTRTNYEVVFQDGTEVEFNGKGQWHSIDCKRAAVPAALIPAAISEYVRQGFPGQDIVKIDKETYGHEIKFASGLELKFSKNGKLVNVDD